MAHVWLNGMLWCATIGNLLTRSLIDKYKHAHLVAPSPLAVDGHIDWAQLLVGLTNWQIFECELLLAASLGVHPSSLAVPIRIDVSGERTRAN
jgi:hypothetical protein